MRAPPLRCSLGIIPAANKTGNSLYPPPPLYKLRPCPSYSRHGDRINLVLWRSLYKGGGDIHHFFCTFHLSTLCNRSLKDSFFLRTPPPLYPRACVWAP